MQHCGDDDAGRCVLVINNYRQVPGYLKALPTYDGTCVARMCMTTVCTDKCTVYTYTYVRNVRVRYNGIMIGNHYETICANDATWKAILPYHCHLIARRAAITRLRYVKCWCLAPIRSCLRRVMFNLFPNCNVKKTLYTLRAPHHTPCCPF